MFDPGYAPRAWAVAAANDVKVGAAVFAAAAAAEDAGVRLEDLRPMFSRFVRAQEEKEGRTMWKMKSVEDFN